MTWSRLRFWAALLAALGACSGIAHAAAPTAPSNLVATAVSASQVNLNWTDRSGNETSFKIERKTGSGSFAQIATVGSNVTSFSNTGLAAGTTYSYRVRASNSSGNSTYTNVASATTAAGPDTTAPTVPSGLVATGVSTSQINLSWTGSTDNVAVTGYRVERCPYDPFTCTAAAFVQIGAPTGTSFSDTGLPPSTYYYYRVRASDAAGNLSAYSDSQVGRTLDPPDTTPPTVPTGVAATVWNASTINLDWNASTDNVGVTEYRIERCTGANCTAFTQVFTFWGVGHIDYGLAAATTYRYRLRAADAAGNLSGYSSIVTATTFNSPDTTPPTAPTGLIAVPASATRIDLSWGPATDEIYPGTVAGYRMERCQGAACTNFVEVAAPQVLYFSNTALTPATTYRYRVRAVDLAGNLGPYSATASATTPSVSSDATAPSTPSTWPVATAVSPTQIDLSWAASTDNVGVTGYRVERGEGCYDPLRWACVTTILVGTPSSTNFSDTGLAPATTYLHRIRAADAAGNLSEYSMWSVATTLSDTVAPSAPGSLSVTVSGGTQLNLNWTASIDNVGVAGYRVERCQGASCTNFTQIATPGGTSFSDTGLSPGTSYRYRVRAADAANNLSVYSNVASGTTNAAVSVSVQSPFNGATIASDTVTVSGTFTGPGNTGIAINGVVAAIVGNTFVAANVPLQLGANTLTATLTTSSNQTATQTLSVTSTGPASIEVVASPTQGVAPLGVAFTLNNRTGNAIQTVQADYLGTGGFATVNPTALSNTYAASGLYQATFLITDSTGASYQRNASIAVQDIAQIDQMLRTSWGEFSTALASGNTPQALTYFNAQAQAKFQPVFQTLAADLPQIVASFSPLQSVSVTGEIGEYAVNRTIAGVDWIFFIYFMRNVDGVWRIDDM